LKTCPSARTRRGRIENHVSAWLGMDFTTFSPEFAGPAWSAIMDPVTVPLLDGEMRWRGLVPLLQHFPELENDCKPRLFAEEHLPGGTRDHRLVLVAIPTQIDGGPQRA
jgi:hypothetical protein